VSKERRSGRAVPIGQAPESVRQALAGQLGEGNLQKRAISFTPDSDGRIGHLDAVEAVVNVNGATEFDIPHSLGRKPTYITLMHYENTATPATIVSFSPGSREGWTETTARGTLHLHAGSLNGLVCHFMVM